MVRPHDAGGGAPVRAADLAQIDADGRLLIYEPSDCCSNGTSKPDTANKRVQTRHQNAPKGIKPDFNHWLDHYQAKGPFHLELDKLALPILHREAQEENGFLHNSRHWLERFAEALDLFHELRDEHNICSNPDAPPIGRVPGGLIAGWAGSEAIDKLSEVFSNVVDQVALYEESLAMRRKHASKEDELRTEVERLSRELKSETAQRVYYWRKLKESQNVLGLGSAAVKQAAADDSDEDDEADGEVPIYTEREMRAVKKQWMRKLEDVEQDWSGRLEKEKQHAKSMEDELRGDIRELRAKLAALERELAAKPAPAAMKSSGSSPAPAPMKSSTGPPLPFRRKQPSSSSGGESRDGSQTGQSQLRGRTKKTKKSVARGTSPIEDVDTSARQADPPPRPASAVRRQPAAKTSVSEEESVIVVPSLDPAPTGSQGGLPRRSRPEAAPTHAPTHTPERADSGERRFVARSWEPGPSEYDTRRLAEELKRRVFEQVIDEERQRQAQMEDEESDQLAARWELQGSGELAHLLRRVDDLALRRELFKVLKNYHKRQPSVLEIVCVYCRRKAKPEHIHSCNVSWPSSAVTTARPSSANTTVPTRPSSATRLPRPGSATGSVASESLRMVGTSALPHVSSSPELRVIGWQNFSRVVQEPQMSGVYGLPEAKVKLHAVLPLAPGRTPSPSPGLLGSSSQPHAVAVGADPSQPHEIVATGIDQTQPHTATEMSDLAAARC
mmetsp:Transcript_144127/g.268497  ORF Transcript_144127/g.268497 Transcript_144127/m.268497 type:complete len:728 (+) Transcript_144127:77-2260(+)